MECSVVSSEVMCNCNEIYTEPFKYILSVRLCTWCIDNKDWLDIYTKSKDSGAKSR